MMTESGAAAVFCRLLLIVALAGNVKIFAFAGKELDHHTQFFGDDEAEKVRHVNCV